MVGESGAGCCPEASDDAIGCSRKLSGPQGSRQNDRSFEACEERSSFSLHGVRKGIGLVRAASSGRCTLYAVFGEDPYRRLG